MAASPWAAAWGGTAPASGAESRPVPLERPSTAQLVADVLRDQMLRGELRPGTQVAEHQLSASLGVSRGSLREGFQILLGEQLLVREAHRGVFVRRLSVDDVRDIYSFRRLVECAALAHPRDPRGVEEMRTAVTEARLAATEGRWDDVGTADVRFHMGVTAAGGSARLDRMMRAVFTELRLAFQLGPDPRALHEPFVPLNAELLELTERGEAGQASARLRDYLDSAESLVVDAVGAG